MCYEISKVKLANLIEDDPKPPFPIATPMRCRRGSYSSPWLLNFTIDPYLIMLC